MGLRGLYSPEADASRGLGHPGYTEGEGSPGPARRVWFGSGWAGLGLSWDFYVWLGFKDEGKTARVFFTH